MPSIALLVCKPPIYSIEISVSQVLQHYSCSCRDSNKINIFQGSNHRLFQKSAFQKPRPAEKSILCIYLLKDPSSFFLQFWYARATTADRLPLGVARALGQPSRTGQCTQREYSVLLLKKLSLSTTTTLELKAHPSGTCHCNFSSSAANITWWHSLHLQLRSF